MFCGFIILQWFISNLQQLLPFKTIVPIAFTLTLSYIGYTWVLLALFQLGKRFVQTLSCLFAAHTMIHIFAFPLLISGPTTPILSLCYLILTFVFAIWQLMVSTYIYKNALSINYFSATMASFGLLACNILTGSFWR
jgi:hypothetical protein